MTKLLDLNQTAKLLKNVGNGLAAAAAVIAILKKG
jgi:hypothetical protein